MKFDFLKLADDNTGDFLRAYQLCGGAEMMLREGLTNDCILSYYAALMLVIKNIYRRGKLTMPTVHRLEIGQEPTDFDYMHKDSPLANWIENGFVLELCHDIRELRNKCVHPYSKIIEQSDVYDLADKLETILRFVLNKLKTTKNTDPLKR